MALTSSSIRLYCAANHPESDSETVGGAIDTTCRPLDEQFTSAAAPEMVSDDANDLMNVTITGRTASGAQDSETNALNGTSAVAWTTTFERILKVEFASAAAGTVLLKQGAGGDTKHTFNAGETDARMHFINAEANASGGSDKVRYEKFFAKNVDSDEDALDFTVELTNDPRTDYDLIVEDNKDDNNSATDRTTEPTGNSGSWGDGPHDIPGTDLAFGEAIGVWVRQTLADGQVPGVDQLGAQFAFLDV